MICTGVDDNHRGKLRQPPEGIGILSEGAFFGVSVGFDGILRSFDFTANMESVYSHSELSLGKG